MAKGEVQEIRMQTRLIDNEVKMMRQDNIRLMHEREQMAERIADNTTKIKQNKVLPYLVSKVVEVGIAVGRERRLTTATRRRCGDPRGRNAQRAERKEVEMRRHQDFHASSQC